MNRNTELNFSNTTQFKRSKEEWLIDNGYLQAPIKEKRITDQQLMEKTTEGGTPNES